jgi:tetratricopeptide (TPR) repeat protein
MKCTDKRIGMWIGSYEMGALEGDEQSIFLEHLIQCEYCYNQVYSIEPFMTAFRDHRAAARRGEVFRSFAVLEQVPASRSPIRMWRLMPVMAALSLVLAISVLVFYFSNRDQGAGGGDLAAAATPWKDTEIPKAPYTPPHKSITLRENDKAFERAMAAYQENNFSSAIEQLETLSELRLEGTAEVKFYLGVSLLLTDRSQEAILPLRQSVQSSVGLLREKGHYYLALAYLKSNQPQHALTELDAAIEMNGAHRSSAESLKEQVSSLTR